MWQMEKSAPSEGAKPVVLALTIGQSPRPALCAPLVGMLPPGVRILEVGALDGITDDELLRIEQLRGGGGNGMGGGTTEPLV